MARKKKHPEHVNHERWLVSYADFITLLFAFFVVMFAVSQVDSKKVGRFTESFSKAIGIDLFPQLGRGIMAGSSEGTPTEEPQSVKPSPLPEDLANLKTVLTRESQEDEALRSIQVIARRSELVLRLSDNLLFQSGNDTLDTQARKVIASLASELRDRPIDIRVEGHTDDRPIKTARFRSNWDLSTARATSIVAFLNSQGIAPPRLSAAGYGEFHPIASNATDEGRKQNRRVDIVVMMPPPPEPPEEAPADAGLEGRDGVEDAAAPEHDTKPVEKQTDDEHDRKNDHPHHP